ncbi:MAG: fimbrial protein [Candidatus Tectimicrobiota bacterium]|nr:MAG: fimbrial protein [Candidatus Tectomicrobia bacterium]
MIRINLLPTRRLQRRLELKRQLLVAAVVLGLTVGGGGWLGQQQQETKSTLLRRLDQLEAELKSLEKIIKEVQQFEKQSKLLQQKIDVINDLKTNQRRPALLLDEISRSLPDQVWLETIQETGSSVKISGKSLNGNPGIAAFMENLEHSPLFGTAELVESKSEIFRQRRVMSFTITVPIRLPQKKQATT